MEESTLWTVWSFKIGLWIDVSLWLSVSRVEPVSDVGASSEDKRITERTLKVFSDQLGQVEDLIEKGDPAIIGGALRSNLRWEIEPSNGVSWREVLEVFVILYLCDP